MAENVSSSCSVFINKRDIDRRNLADSAGILTSHPHPFLRRCEISISHVIPGMTMITSMATDVPNQYLTLSGSRSRRGSHGVTGSTFALTDCRHTVGA